ncbi:cytochrome P450 [Guyanagaster necrorhizus]|uniref:Cytochrome P450 n=1 Tax=Guyanagaster necrorhizus TaxID=856835 RepID=A0A9P7VX96_9AGAR|nr:cytochrome P450 [Guyanagaster necrorhizus MCA 3950]KAG7448607.1 cytochrome P450 [Guyanagaster necrorhizus MCA 3950]
MLPSLSCTIFAGLLIIFISRLLRVRRSSSLPLPPGPPSLPILGNVTVMPSSHEWLTYDKWAKIHGDIIRLNVFGQSLIILSSLETARNLLDRQSAISSDRPRFVMISDLMGWDWAVQFMSTGHRFRKYRRTVQQCLQPQSLSAYLPIVEKGSRELLKSLLEDPSNFQAHIKHHSGGMMMSILYGEQEGVLRDQYVSKADAAIDGLVEAGNVGKFYVDFLPFLRYVPAWVPGAGFQKQARLWRRQAREMIEIPFENTKKAYENGVATPSVTETLIRQQLLTTAHITDPELIMGAAGVLFVGGGDTSLSALDTFILAMVLYPNAQKRAQAEIDSVVGGDRLPEFSDRSSLPFFECVLSEVLRWNPAVPLGVPHRVSENTDLNGYQIPAGATVLVNQWAILHDEKEYPEPFEFRPERFMPPSDDPMPLNPREASFGFGRRICPGRHFSDSLLWMIMVRIVAAFELDKQRDASGGVVEVKGEYLSGLVTRPAPFACQITPRLKLAEELESFH